MSRVRHFLARVLQKAAFKIDPRAPQVDASDDYTRWLCIANAGMLERGNIHLIDTALRQLSSDAPILEIGSFCGLSTNVLTHFKRKYGLKNRLITCDKWEFENNDKDKERVGGSPVLFSDYKQLVRDSYIRNTQLFSCGDLPYTIEATSDEFFSFWKDNEEKIDVLGRSIHLGGPLSFCYIDGNHTYVGARKDFLNCDAFLEPGGFLLFDDSTHEMFGVRHLMPEVSATQRYKLVATNPCHLFQKIQG